jgi:adenosylmethionine-8-amino-7-oxononanoate aminotransferase
VREEGLVDNVKRQGLYLEKCLRSRLADHPNVGDIRGRGLFWGLEFVKNKITKEPFDARLGVAQRVLETAISAPFNMTMYPGTGCADGIRGDHVILAPAYNVTKEDIEHVARVVSDVVHLVFRKLGNL